MRILVTGGAGFIGNHLCRRLVREGHEVICFDNLFTGRESNIGDLIVCPNFRFVKGDVTEPFDYEVDQIYNLACPASPIHYQEDEIKTLQTSFIGTYNCLENAVKYNARLLHTSTSEIYGDPKVHPQKEEYWGNVNPIGVRACYDEGKRAAEALIFSYKRMYDADVKGVRLFNTYGPYMNPQDGRVVSNLIVEALAGRDLTVYGDGSQTRSFCYIDDTLEAIVRMMNDTSRNFSGPVNIGNPSERTVLDLATKIQELTGTSSKIVFEELPKDDPTRRKPDISLAKEMLNWEPKVDIEEGLSKTIRYFKKTTD